MAVKLLIAAPDAKWLKEACKYFKDHSYHVTTVENGKSVQLSLYREKFFAVILNTEIKNHPANQVLTFIKTNYPSLKIILLSGEDAAEDEYAMEWGTDTMEKAKKIDILKQPFELKDIKCLLEGHQSIGDILSMVKKKEELSPEEECDLPDVKFTKIKIAEFYISQPVLFDIFIKLSTNRYIKILHAGDVMSKERIDKYVKEKKIEYLYFQKDELHKYIKFANRFSKDAIDSKKIHSAKKIKLLQNVSEKISGTIV